jgi:hypothetical protein
MLAKPVRDAAKLKGLKRQRWPRTAAHALTDCMQRLMHSGVMLAS